MTPLPGQVYERDGIRRCVQDVDMFGHVTYRVLTDETHVVGKQAWGMWARRARLVAAEKAAT